MNNGGKSLKMKGKSHLFISLALLFLMQAGGICWSQTTTLVSVASVGVQDPDPSSSSSSCISSNGRYVAFESDANDLVASDTNPLSDIFVYEQDPPPPNTIHSNENSGGGGRSCFSATAESDWADF